MTSFSHDLIIILTSISYDLKFLWPSSYDDNFWWSRVFMTSGSHDLNFLWSHVRLFLHTLMTSSSYDLIFLSPQVLMTSCSYDLKFLWPHILSPQVLMTSCFMTSSSYMTSCFLTSSYDLKFLWPHVLMTSGTSRLCLSFKGLKVERSVTDLSQASIIMGWDVCAQSLNVIHSDTLCVISHKTLFCATEIGWQRKGWGI